MLLPILSACEAPESSPADPDDPTAAGTTSSPVTPTGTLPTTPPVAVDPPFGGTSGGDGGADAPDGATITVDGFDYVLVAPTGSADATAVPFLLAMSGVEGASAMSTAFGPTNRPAGYEDIVVAVLDGRYATADDTVAVLDDVRGSFDVDNDRTWLLSQSASTSVGLEVGLSVRQQTFAAYWANDVSGSRAPDRTAAELGFAPWGNAGPGGRFDDAEAIVDGMREAGYQLPEDAPYSGPGAPYHGAPQQFQAALAFFPDKVRAP